MLLDRFLTLRDIAGLMRISGTVVDISREGRGQSAGAAVPGSDPISYRFAGFRLLAGRQALESGGGEAELSTKLYHLLLAFLRNPGQILGKDDIILAVWPGQVVTDAALAKQVQRLRGLLQDRDRDHPLIETHRGLGYRLTCTVEPEYVAEASPGRRGAPARSYRGRYAVAALVLVAGLAGLVLRQAVSDAPLSGAPDPGAVAIMPVAGSAPALSEGAADHLALRLGATAEISPLLMSGDDPARATALASLRLEQRRGSPVAAVHFERSAAAAGYELWIDLRQQGGSESAVLRGASASDVLEQGYAWLQARVDGSQSSTGIEDGFAITSYFEGLAAGECSRATDYFRAAVASDPAYAPARLALARCELESGQAEAAAATASAVLSAGAGRLDRWAAFQARMLSARAKLQLGKAPAARVDLEAARELGDGELAPLRQGAALRALAMLAALEGRYEEARSLHEDRLALARREFPVAGHLTSIHLDLTQVHLAAGNHELLRDHASSALALAEESGDLEALVQSYRYLAFSYFRTGDIDAAVQLAFAARPYLDRVDTLEHKAFFMQSAAMALNLSGRFDASRDYSARLKALAESSSNPMFGAVADLTVMHRLYVRGRFREASMLASSLRSRIERDGELHASLPAALAIEAIGAARGSPLDEARVIARRLRDSRAGEDAFTPALLRAEGHIAAREGNSRKAVSLLRRSEAAYRQEGALSVANYVGYEIAELRMAAEPTAPWDDLVRLRELGGDGYFLARLEAEAHARDNNLVGAAQALEEARARGHDLWSEADQLLLERLQAGPVIAESTIAAASEESFEPLPGSAAD